MAIGQTLADILGGLVAINKGDPSGAQAFTGQGRADLAQQRGNTRTQQDLMSQVLQQAKTDPKINAFLQQQMAPYLQNQSTQAGTEHVQAQTRDVLPAQVANYQASTQNTQGRTALQQPEFDLQKQHVNAQTAEMGAQTAATNYNLGQNQNLDRLASFSGFPNWAAMTQFMQMNMRGKEMAQQAKMHEQQTAADIYSHTYADASGNESPVQKAARERAGIVTPVGPDPMAQQRAALLQEIQAMRGEKKQPKQSTPAQPQQQGGSWLGTLQKSASNIPQQAPPPPPNVPEAPPESFLGYLMNSASNRPDRGQTQPTPESTGMTLQQIQTMIQQLLQQQQ